MLDYLSVTQEQLTIVNEGESSNIFELVVDEALYKILMKLGKKEKEVIQLILGDQLKQIEIARILNESPQNIAKTKKKALMKIRKQYEKRG
ncbi:sigma factor-like helix-turn-helix DNA-binding protein [Bacillus sp. NTK034]|nr:MULTISPECIES: sigma factor-like helix-turn-helix DNA-binding protein [Bacillaceae]MBN8203899.1 sigma-70 family RNA polymerase sigma factor [Bacillus sp. NTK034]